MVLRTFNLKYFILFSVGFVLFTVIGTLSHELGHICFAKHLGFDVELSYGSMNYDHELYKSTKKYYYANKENILCDVITPEKIIFNRNFKKAQNEKIFITLGGPIQTIMTGSIGLFALYYRRRCKYNSNFKLIDWFFTFITLFWLREVFNLIMPLLREFITPNGNYFGYHGDEVKLSYYFDLPAGTFPIFLGLLGLVISLIVVFKVVPVKFRLTFIFSGAFGGILGFYLWMKVIGPILLP